MRVDQEIQSKKVSELKVEMKQKDSSHEVQMKKRGKIIKITSWVAFALLIAAGIAGIFVLIF